MARKRVPEEYNAVRAFKRILHRTSDSGREARSDSLGTPMATILIVDDSQPNRLYLRTLLRPGGHRLLEAADGAQALELVGQEQPDLVISDILMPTMDGYQFARQLRSEPAVAGTPVIFFTATYHEPEAQALAQACGVLLLLAKPSDPDTILLAVNEALGLAPPTPALPAPGEFDREHLQLLTNKLAEKVRELEMVNSRLTAMYEQTQEHALRLEQEVVQRQQAEAAVRSLSRQLLAAQEAERRHIARELHDQVGQALTALKINLEGLQRIAGGGAAMPWLKASTSLRRPCSRCGRCRSTCGRPCSTISGSWLPCAGIWIGRPSAPASRRRWSPTRCRSRSPPRSPRHASGWPRRRLRILFATPGHGTCRSS